MDWPPFITAATGMDALTHNMEAYLAKMPHPMCEGIALEGISLINQSLEKAVNSPDLQSRAKMLATASISICFLFHTILMQALQPLLNTD